MFWLVQAPVQKDKGWELAVHAEVINKSAECNYAQLVSREDGSTIVPTFNWTDFFAPKMRKIKGIKKLHHFKMDSASPGCVLAKEQCDTPEVKYDLLKTPWTPDDDNLPGVVPPHGLNAERQWYLYNQIHPFCPAEDMDSVPFICPQTWWKLTRYPAP